MQRISKMKWKLGITLTLLLYKITESFESDASDFRKHRYIITQESRSKFFRYAPAIHYFLIGEIYKCDLFTGL